MSGAYHCASVPYFHLHLSSKRYRHLNVLTRVIERERERVGEREGGREVGRDTQIDNTCHKVYRFLGTWVISRSPGMHRDVIQTCEKSICKDGVAIIPTMNRVG